MNEMELSTLIIIVPVGLLASVFLFFNHHTDKKKSSLAGQDVCLLVKKSKQLKGGNNCSI